MVDNKAKIPKWKTRLENLWSQHPTLAAGVAASFVILVVFFVLQHYEAKVLNLDSRWVSVSLLPLLVALLVGGYIKSFKGFGVELEARLKNPVSSVSLNVTDAAEELRGDEKRTLNYLRMLDEQERSQNRHINRLIFVIGRHDYYSSAIISEYIRVLRNLKYFEIREDDGEFVALRPISKIKRNNDVDTELVSQFVHALEERAVFPLFQSGAIRRFVNESDSLVEALRMMRKANAAHIAVVTDDKQFVGLLSARDVEKRIADEVLASKL